MKTFSFCRIFVSIRFISPVLLLFFMLSGASLNPAGMRQIRPSGVRCYSGKEKSPPPAALPPAI